MRVIAEQCSTLDQDQGFLSRPLLSTWRLSGDNWIIMNTPQLHNHLWELYVNLAVKNLVRSIILCIKTDNGSWCKIWTSGMYEKLSVLQLFHLLLLCKSKRSMIQVLLLSYRIESREVFRSGVLEFCCWCCYFVFVVGLIFVVAVVILNRKPRGFPEWGPRERDPRHRQSRLRQ